MTLFRVRVERQGDGSADDWAGVSHIRVGQRTVRLYRRSVIHGEHVPLVKYPAGDVAAVTITPEGQQ